MSSVDNRIVNMQFNNTRFQKNAKDTISVLDKLKKGLNLDSATKSLENLKKTGDSFSLAGIAKGVDSIAGKFSTLGIVGVTALQNITNAAIQTGTQLLKSLTLDPITSGFTEYETKMNAITTILTNTASKGTTLEDVNAALAELNTYADQTIYNFAEMTRNIGTFTAAGLDLETSVNAIKGIANLAAGSGSSAVQASTAMYQLSQALAAGRVSLQDWNSVVNAGMGGELFQNALKETAKEMGIFVDESKPFRETLQDGWVTSEVLATTLSKFAEDESLVKAATQVKTFTQLFDTMKESVQSGWAESWEYIVGDKDQATETLTAVSDEFNAIIGPSADARNAALKFWNANGGRQALIDGLANAFKGLASILSPVSDAFKNVFPSITGERLVEFSEGFKDLTENFKIGEKTANNIRRTFEGLFSIFSIGRKGITAFLKSFTNLIGAIMPAGDGILGFTATIGDFLVEVDKAVDSTNIFEKTLGKIESILLPIVKGFSNFVKAMGDTVSSFADIDTSGLDSFSEKVRARLEPFNALGAMIKTSFLGIAKAFQKLAPITSRLAETFLDAFRTMQKGVADSLENFNFDNVFDIINSGIIAAILMGIKKFIGSLSEVVESGGGILKNLTEILDGVKGSLEAWQTSLKADTLIKIAGAVGLLSAALITLSLIDSKRLTSSLTAITVLFADLIGSMALFEKIISGISFKSLFLSGRFLTTMIGMAAAITILTVAMANLSRLDWAGVAKGLSSVAGLSLILVASAKGLSKASGGLISTATGLVIFSSAILVLTNAVKELGAIDVDELTNGLVAVGVLCTELALFMKAADLDKMGVLKGTGIILLATSINILSISVEKFSSMDFRSVTNGLTAVGIVLGELAIFSKLTANSKGIIRTATGMTILASSLLIFSEAIDRMGSMPVLNLTKGLLGMATSLTAVSLAMNFLPSGMLTKSVGMIGIASALIILSDALKTMGGFSWDEITRGLATLAGSLGILALGMIAMQNAIPGAAALLIISSALRIFSPIISSFGNLSLEQIGKSLLTLASTFAVFGVAGLALSPLTPTLIALAGALTLFGAATVAVGAGVLAFATGLSVLSVSGTAAAASLVVVMTSVASLIPMFIKQIGVGIVELIGVVANSGEAFSDAFVTLIKAAISAITETVPEILNGADVLLKALYEFLIEQVPALGNALVDLFVGAMGVLSERMPDVVNAAMKVVATLFQTLSDVFDSASGGSAAGALKAITSIVVIFGVLAAASTVSKQAIKGAVTMLAVMGIVSAVFIALSGLPIEQTTGIATGLSALLLSLSTSMAIISIVPISGALTGIAGLAIVIAGLTAILAAMGGLAQIPGFDWLMGEGTKVLGMIGTAIGSFFGNIAGGFVTGITGKFPQIGTDLSNFMKNAEPFFSGISNVNQNAVSGVKALAQTVLILTAADILNGLTSWLTGGSSMVDFGKQIADFAPYFQKYYESIKGIDPSVVEASGNAAKSLAEFANNIPNQGGVAAFFAGENSLVEFADQLSEFGPKLKRYADSVQGLDANVVTNSANAAKALSEMAANLPNQGGVVSWFTGDNTLSAFAKELVQFGPRLKAYAVSVQGLDAGVVVNSANAAKALSELASNLPNTGGLVSLFTGDNSIASFGDDLAKFGGYLANYYESISGISFPQLSLAITEVNKLIDLTGRMADTDTSVLGSFGQSLTRLGNSGVEGFISAFTNASGRVKQAGANLSKFAEQGLKLNQLIFGQTGTKYGNDFSTNLSNRQTSAKASGRSVSIAAEQGLKSNSSAFGQTGMTYGNNFANRLSATSSAARTAAVQVVSSAVSGISSKLGEFENAGRNAGQGFINGIRSKAGEAADAAASVVREALAAADRALDAHSPSKEFETRGVWSIQGLILGFLSQAGKLYSTVHDVGKTAVDTMGFALEEAYEYANSNMDFEPTITPVLDLSKVRSGVGLVNGLFAGTTLNAVTSLNGARVVSSGMKNQTNYETPETAPTAKGDTYNIFNQTNNSPKALSRLDIYRQTKNLFALAKGPVNYR